MTVKELIYALQRCNPEAVVFVEVHESNDAKECCEYVIDNLPCVYIGDDLRPFEERILLRAGDDV